jgi:hypothetical protein
MENAIVKNGQTQVDFFNENSKANAWQTCCTLASSALAPQSYQNKPENVFAALMQSQNMGIDIFTFMRGSYMYKSNLSFTGKMIVALLNSSGKLSKGLRWRFETFKKGEQGVEGSIKSCTCIFNIVGEDEPQEFELTWQEVLDNGWTYTKEGAPKSKWHTMTRKMFMYRTASWGADLFLPEVLNGIQEADSLIDSELIEVQAEEEEAPKIAKPNFIKAKKEEPKEVEAEVIDEDESKKVASEKVQKGEAVVENSGNVETVKGNKKEVTSSLIDKINATGKPMFFGNWLREKGMLQQNQPLASLDYKYVKNLFENWNKALKEFNAWYDSISSKKNQSLK